MNATRSQLIAQYKRAKALLWTEHFREAANTHTPDLFDTADLMAIGSRETNLDPKWLTKKGDNGHGAGLMQIDDRSFPGFTNSTKWKDARLGIMYGAQVLRQKWDDLQKNAGKRLTVKNYTFTGPHVSGLIAQQIAIAAYNSGRWAAYHYTKGRDPDYGTTGKDYSSDVMQRARVFRELLGKDGMLDSAAATTQPTEKLANDSTANDANLQTGADTTAGLDLLKQPPPSDTQPDPPPEPAPANDAVTVPPVVTETTTAAVVVSKAHGWYASLPLGVTSFLGGVIAWIQGASTEIVAGFFGATALIGMTWIIMNQWGKAKAAALAHEASESQKVRDFELTKLQMMSAMDKKQNTVLVAPPVTEIPATEVKE